MSFRIVHIYFCAALIGFKVLAQSPLPIGLDTLTVFESGKHLISGSAGGLNYCNIFNADINGDGLKDIILYDKIHFLNYGKTKCFINVGTVGQAKYQYHYYYSNAFPVLVNWAEYLDFNNDGKVDIFTSTTGGIKVFKNISTGNQLKFQLFKNIIYSNYNPTGTAQYIPIYAAFVGLPGIIDIDNDGDLDILSFSSTGFSIEYHINKSMELYGNADSLVYEINTNCWGNISENNCSISIGQCNGRTPKSDNNNKVYHSGSCLMCFDPDNDGDKDLILGDVTCNNIIYANNNGTPSNCLINDTTKLYPNYPGKNSTQIVKMSNFPCTYNLDVDNDGKKDLLASPNINNGENFKNIWLYKNIGTSKDSFIFVKNNFLTEDMIDVGEGAYPLLIDINQDGKKDLLIGNHGYFNLFTPTANISSLTYYQNTGTITTPQFSLVTRDYLNLSALNRLGLFPTSGDIDGDGDIDLLVGDSQGNLTWLENTAGAGFPCNFSITHNNAFGITIPYPPIFPQLFDVNSDGKLDLIIGNKQSRITYYKNISITSTPNFSMITNNFGNVNTNPHPIQYAGDGACIPFMYQEGTKKYLLCGSMSGNLFLYNQIEGNETSNFNLLDTMVNSINNGLKSSPQYIDINNDNKRDLIVGNYAGGITYYSSKTVGINEVNDAALLKIYPNPTQNLLYIEQQNNTSIKLTIYDITGKEITSEIIQYPKNYINISELTQGIYFLKTEIAQQVYFFKIIKN